MSYDQLVETSRAFVRRFPQTRENWLWILERMTELVWPLRLEVLPEYAQDYDVLRCVRNAVRSASRKENRDKILVFDSLSESRLLAPEEMKGLDPKVALQTFDRLEAFLNIYKMEWRLSVSIVPFGDLIDELESIIERFRLGENNRVLIEPMRLLSRRVGRRWAQGIASGALASFSLYVLTPFEQIPQFLSSVAYVGLPMLIALFIVSTMETWESFPALLSSKQPSQDES